MMDASQVDADDLFLVDCGIESLANVYLNLPNLRTLNLHSNYITRIENLSSLSSLVVLDLSSNQIARMEGLEHLSSLKQLNLSCNLITIVEGLSNLRCLVALNLSYNQIVNINGLKRLPPTNSLATVQLQGNNLTDINHILLCAKCCRHLTCLVLQDGQTASNPVCANTDYETVLRQQIPSLRSMEKPSPDSDDSRTCGQHSVNEVESKTSVASTPRIDAVLDRFHKALEKRQLSPPPTSRTDTLSESSSSSHLFEDKPEMNQERKKLQQQLDDLQRELLKKKIEAAELELQQMNQPSPHKEEIKETVAAPGKARRQVNVNNNASKQPSHKSTSMAASAPTIRGKAAARNADVLYRDAVNCTYQQLIKDLDMERVRRCKAEEAARQLAQKVKATESESHDQQLARRNCDDLIKKLRDELRTCQEKLEEKRESAEKAQVRCKEQEGELRRCHKTTRAQEHSIRKLEEVQERLEQLKADTDRKHKDELSHQQTLLNEKMELLKTAQTTVTAQRSELDDMKSLLAAREAQHRQEMDERYTLDSPKLEQLLQSKVSNIVREHAAERNGYEQRLTSSAQEYSELEEEFRMALQIEADRFQALKNAFEDLSGRQLAQEKALLASQSEAQKSANMVTNLTQLVKEQRDKIISLSNDKQKLELKTQGTKTKLEQQVDNLNNKVKDVERLKKDNLELKNQVQGQHSIISGLRKERELWSRELVDQGTSLSNERGLMQAKIETLEDEKKSLKASLQAEVDAVKIKAKLVSDLTETVSGLKQKLNGCEADLKCAESRLQTIKEEHVKELEEEKLRCSDMEEDMNGLVARKNELKDQLQATQQELSHVKDSHRSLKAKWQEKSSSIAMLEKQVKEMKDSWTDRERKLSEERDKAIEAADLALQRLKTADDGFRKQLDSKELSFEQQTRDLTNRYELKIAEQQHKVDQVEEEMRDLLLEKEQAKRQFDGRLKRLGQALSELQQE